MHTNYADVQEGEKVVIPLSTLEFVPGGNSIWINGGQGCTTLGVKPLEKINIEQCTSSADSHADIMLADDINFCISLNAPWRGLMGRGARLSKYKTPPGIAGF